MDKLVNYGTRIWSGFALALASLVLVGVVGISTIHSLIDRDGWVNHSLIVIDRLAAVGSTTKSLQSDLLGYAATGEDHFLRSARVEGEALAGEVDRVRKLVVDNPSQSRRVADLAVLLEARRKVAQRSLAAAAEGDLLTAAARILHGPGWR
jgi:CHASE3 domain sensor protein